MCSMIWIDAPEKLSHFLAPLREGGLLALDTEFLRTDTYYPKLCLIQLARQDGEIALIDPLACKLKPLWTHLQNPAVTVVVHAAFQDLEVLYQAGGVLPARLVDTQLLALLHGFGDRIGLGALLQQTLHVELPKDATRTDWCRRPLTRQQLDYAADDVRHLIPLHEALWTPLGQPARQALMEDFQDQLDPEHYCGAPEAAWRRLNGGRHLSAKQQTLLRRLAAWRERTAQAENRPRRWIIGDDALMALAKRPPTDIHKLKNVPGLSAPQIRQYGEAIIEVIDAAFAAGEWKKEKQTRLRPTAAEEPLLALARAVVQQQALRFRFSPAAFDTHTLLRWLRHREGVLARGWRRLLIGDPLSRIQRGEPLIWQDDQLKVPHAPIFEH